MLSAVHGGGVSVDLLANDMWAMGVVLVWLLSGYSTFGINYGDSPELVAKGRDRETQAEVASAKQCQWVSLLSLVHASMRSCKAAVASHLQCCLNTWSAMFPGDTMTCVV